MNKTFYEKVDFWSDVGKVVGIVVWFSVPATITAIYGFHVSLLPFIILGLFVLPLMFNCIFAFAAICILHSIELRRTEKKSKIDEAAHSRKAKKAEVDGFIKLCRSKS